MSDKPVVTTFEEWRVTGTWQGEPYAFTWSPMRVKRPEGYEQEARAFIAQVGDYDWSDGPHLHRRTVTVTEWQEVDGVDDQHPELHVQWKGTEVCGDFRCSCGATGHIDDAMFCYTIACGRCGKVWDVPTDLALTPSTETMPHVTAEPDDPRDTDWSRQ